jgi:hypothetical protein
MLCILSGIWNFLESNLLQILLQYFVIYKESCGQTKLTGCHFYFLQGNKSNLKVLMLYFTPVTTTITSLYFDLSYTAPYEMMPKSKKQRKWNFLSVNLLKLDTLKAHNIQAAVPHT